ncbi:MAG: hypothetical protein CFH22_00346 [Alphaproteobacteria bacterium MarineAlpha5_Bin12]|nr:hypothetical protein [Pelagibacteraceae bacterium]PPR41804.1 MAG: hypothetical protein CFH22_00346 [Alphaproteobacteria bacterium MarineAlpha5_Bin12]|tara:strand:+ start:1133 stop:2134 length:1002 start_codon:yes stop_codon:yes gene_type:complete
MHFGLSNQIRFIGVVIVALTFTFLINNFFNFWADWPGVISFLKYQSILSSSNSEFSEELIIKSSIQFYSYLFIILLSLIYVLFTSKKNLITESKQFSNFSAYIIRACFWAVLLIGIVDMILSFLRVEDLLIPIFGEKLGMDLNRSNFRGTYVHFPILLISLIIAYFTSTLGFMWLAFLVVIAEFQIVLARFIFSYEQTFMGDLVRFWYGALFLFASSYALLNEGHVRVDILFTKFSKIGKAWSNLIGSLLLGIPICWVILLRGMWCKQCVINAPLTSFETSMSGYGMQVKYLMAGFLAIYALTMLIQFVSFFLNSSAIIVESKNQNTSQQGNT